MGYWKDRMISQQEQGWDFVDDGLYVCGECFNDAAITDFIERSASKKECSYCEESSDEPIAASMNSVLALIGAAVTHGYTDPANTLPREDGDWVFGSSIMDIDEVLGEIGWPTENDEVADDIRDAFSGRSWVKRHFFGLSEQDQLRYGWDDFVEAVKHHTRFLFSTPSSGDDALNLDQIPPHKMLDEIGKTVDDVQLIKVMKAGTPWQRARIHDPQESYSTASELGTAPVNKAAYSNRMSPAGIPMFYGAADEATAIAETYLPKEGRKAVASIATFQTARQITVLDLTDLPSVPSPFDETARHLRPAIIFLHDFVEDLIRPIAKDQYEHIEYIPTQIVTEYFRRVFHAPVGEPVKGILYRSSRNGEGTCCVLFFENEHCCEATTGWETDEKNWLGLIGSWRKEL